MTTAGSLDYGFGFVSGLLPPSACGFFGGTGRTAAGGAGGVGCTCGGAGAGTTTGGTGTGWGGGTIIAGGIGTTGFATSGAGLLG